LKIIKGGITAPQGFLAAGIPSGIKKSGKKDLALIYSEVTASAAGLFTSNKVKAAPIIVSQDHISSGKARAIIANAGCANACTGHKGIEDAKQMAFAAASMLNVPPEQILVASTGTISKPLPMDNILGGMRSLGKKLSKAGSADAADAILTTDLKRKEIAVQIMINKKPVRIGGIAKGSGMIHPDLVPPRSKYALKYGFGITPGHATMFCFITTDAEVKSPALGRMLKKAADASFNMITVDKDTSTNDCVFALANGMSKCGRMKRKDEAVFYSALEEVCKQLAKEIARDGEGATKLIEVRVEGAKSVADAAEISKSVAGSNLVKTAMFGQDPNFGRIMAAIGYSKAEIDPNRVNLFIGEHEVVRDGRVVNFNDVALKNYMKKDQIVIMAEIGLGKGAATAWGCDLTYDYVKINAKYTT